MITLNYSQIVGENEHLVNVTKDNAEYLYLMTSILDDNKNWKSIEFKEICQLHEKPIIDDILNFVNI